MHKHTFVYFASFTLLLAACSDISSSSSSSSSLVSSVSSSVPIDSTSSSDASSSISSSLSSGSTSLSIQERINADLASITYTLGAPLPTRGPNGSSYSWASSHPNIINNKGAYVELPIGASNVNVELTVTATLSGSTGTRIIQTIATPPVPPALTRTVNLPFVNTSEEYLVTNQASVPVYFTENGTVPYMDVERFMNMVDGAIDFSVLDFVSSGSRLVVSYTLEDVDSNNQPIFFSYEAELDFTANTFTVDDFSFFSNYVRRTETNFSEGLSFLGGIGLNAQTVTIPLGDYRVDLVQQNNLFLAPVSILNLLFLNAIYYDVYYNGDKLYGFDTFTALDGESPVLNEMKTSSFNGLTMASDLKQSTYHFLALAFDYFYGLKEDKNIDTFYDVLVPYMERILIGSDRNLYSALFAFAYGLDDLHTWHEATGFYEPTTYSLPLTSLNQLGQKTQDYYTNRWALEDLMEAAFGVDNSAPPSRLLDNDRIAVISFRNFTVDTPSQVNALLQALPNTVESVIIDLSMNTGGNVGAVFRLLGYMTEETIQYSSMNPVDGSAATYFYESSYVAYDYDWYIMTSSVTFSAANLMASMAQEMGVATIIGGRSSGGAASIGLVVTPDGTILLRSTLNVFATVTVDSNQNRTYRSVESGVPVDYSLANPYDDNAIISLINTIRSSRT